MAQSRDRKEAAERFLCKIENYYDQTAVCNKVSDKPDYRFPVVDDSN
jgi:hypothetical protein